MTVYVLLWVMVFPNDKPVEAFWSVYRDEGQCLREANYHNSHPLRDFPGDHYVCKATHVQ